MEAKIKPAKLRKPLQQTIQEFVFFIRTIRALSEPVEMHFHTRMQSTSGGLMQMILYAPKCLKKMYTVAKEKDADLVYCDYAFYPNKIKTKEKWFRPFTGERNTTYVERNSQLWNKIVRRELLSKLNIGEMFEKCFDDSYIKVLLEANNPVSINEELYFYRMGQPSLSSSYKNVNYYTRFIEASKSLKKHMEYYWKNNIYWKEYFDYRIIYYTLIAMLVSANSEQKSTYKQLKEFLKKQYPQYHHNQHIHFIMNENFGLIKRIAIEYGVTVNYRAACILAFLALR